MSKTAWREDLGDVQVTRHDGRLRSAAREEVAAHQREAGGGAEGTVKQTISLDAEQTLLQLTLQARRSESNRKVGEIFALERKAWSPQVPEQFFANAPARGSLRVSLSGRVSNVVSDLCVKYQLDLESGIEIYSAVGLQNFFFFKSQRWGQQASSTLFKKVFFNRLSVGWFNVQLAATAAE